jgi:hypothetical protein
MVFDARPDRIDLRDREYQPILKLLPSQYPEQQSIQQYRDRYVKDQMILDQGKEGACTGFGLAAVINYLNWKQALEQGNPVPKKVSARMLYHLARFYDEWPGEDYEGSSCRGAMKGWHRHGVCREDYWPYRDEQGKVRFVKPKKGWDEDAALRPLGAYYRINKDSISDMQAAIYEVGAIYVSAKVHDGWFQKKWKLVDRIAVIGSPQSKETGGHSFAIVGYNQYGFIVQNSWNDGWGTKGFAILPYADWVERGMDAWVAVLGAPMVGAKSRHYLAPASLHQTASEPAQLFGLLKRGEEPPYVYKSPEVAPWDQDKAYQHSIVMGNNGTVLNRSVKSEDAQSSLDEIAYTQPLAWLNQDQTKVVFYAHGGLNSEEDSIARVRILGPYFKANGMYPIFFTWTTGFLESLKYIIGDATLGIEPQGAWRDIWESVKDAAKEAKDRAIEVACQNVLVKTVWSQMKQNAEASASFPNAALQPTVECIKNLQRAHKNLEVHLIGHSAGSILLGHLLALFVQESIQVTTCTLYAPACTVQFALKYYQPAINSGGLDKSALTFEILTDEREQTDSVGPYGKSLLYLVSRALEDYHKTPLLGMENAWKPQSSNDSIWNEECRNHVKEWLKFWGHNYQPNLHGKDRAQVSNGPGFIPLVHGSFDNDVKVMTDTLKRILGRNLKYPIENLRGY